MGWWGAVAGRQGRRRVIPKGTSALDCNWTVKHRRRLPLDPALPPLPLPLPRPAPQLTAPVQFEGSIKALLERGLERSYEIGPNKAGSSGVAVVAVVVVMRCSWRPEWRPGWPACIVRGTRASDCVHTFKKQTEQGSITLDEAPAVFCAACPTANFFPPNNPSTPSQVIAGIMKRIDKVGPCGPPSPGGPSWPATAPCPATAAAPSHACPCLSAAARHCALHLCTALSSSCPALLPCRRTTLRT